MIHYFRFALSNKNIAQYEMFHAMPLLQLLIFSAVLVVYLFKTLFILNLLPYL